MRNPSLLLICKLNSLIKSIFSRRISRSVNYKDKQKHDEGELTVSGLLEGGDLSEAFAAGSNTGEGWAGTLPEIMWEIIKRVEESEDRWPERRNVVSCACVCKKWRDVTEEIVKSLASTGKITFPSCLKQTGHRELPHQCFIKRNKKTSTFYLYLALTPSFVDTGKFLLAARRYRYGTHTEYIISLDADDLSKRSNAYVGKLSSDFIGTNFTIYDSQTSKQMSPQVPGRYFNVGQVSYKTILFKSSRPRKMMCSLKCPVSQELKTIETVLLNKAPRWNEDVQRWCLNFDGEVTASVKNFQLVATVDQSQRGDEQSVVLQFGKVGDDTFMMIYRHPLSAFQAFAICLSSFGKKLGCD